MERKQRPFYSILEAMESDITFDKQDSSGKRYRQIGKSREYEPDITGTKYGALPLSVYKEYLEEGKLDAEYERL